MEETEQMVALKKAYAEIILNTAKEAASRVMAAERKAVRFQHDLRSTKDEALRMLLRFKQMIDAKTRETEITSISQQRKIEELDAQLNEAEGVILDLRAELRRTQDQLEKVKNDKILHKDEQFEKQTVASLENVTYDKTKDTVEPFTASLQISKCCNSENQTATSCYHYNNLFGDNPNLASIIMASKEPELYRNGCTQRIRAFEKNFHDGDLLLLSETLADQACIRKNEEVVNANGQNKGTSTSPSTKAKNRGTKSLVGSDILPIINVSDKDQSVKFRKLPRRRTLSEKSKATSFRLRRCQSNKHRHSSLVFPHCGRSISTDNKNVRSRVVVSTQPVTKLGNSVEHGEKGADNDDQGLSILRRSQRKRKIRCWDNLKNSSKPNSSQFKETCLSGSDLSSCKKHWGKYGVRSSEHRPKAKYEDSELIEILVQGEDEVTEHPGFPSCNVDSYAGKELSYDLIATNETAGQTDKDRLLKYTFSRRRKKGLLSKSVDCFSLGNNSTNSRIGEIVNICPELLDSTLMTESSKDSQNLVEIACQLVSLSGK